MKVEKNEQLNLKPIFKLSYEISDKNNKEWKKIVNQAEEILKNRFDIFDIKIDYGEKNRLAFRF